MQHVVAVNVGHSGVLCAHFLDRCPYQRVAVLVKQSSRCGVFVLRLCLRAAVDADELALHVYTIGLAFEQFLHGFRGGNTAD